jgi:L-fuconolactonase
VAGQPLPPVVDTHHHLWDYVAAEHPWMTDEFAALRRSFTLADYTAATAAHPPAAAIAVQSIPYLKDNDFLLAALAGSTIPHYVVGWFDLLRPDALAHIERWGPHPAVVGARHFLNWEEDNASFADPRLTEALRALARHGLAFDLLVRPNQLVLAADLAARIPELTFVLDHLGNPRIGGPDLGWRDGLRALAEHPNVYIKVSGVTDNTDGRPFDDHSFDPYFGHAAEVVGLDRLIFGSDWPVVRTYSSYDAWLRIVAGFFGRHAPDSLAAVLGETARRAYGVTLTSGD